MRNEHISAPPTGHDRGGYEKSDLSVKAIVVFGAVLAVVLVGSLVAMGWLFGFFSAEEAKRDVPPSPLATTRPAVPEPRLQVDAIGDLKRLRAAEDAILGSYGWVSKETGMARIPIDRAMRLLVDRGLPVPAKEAAGGSPAPKGGRP